MAWLMIVQFIGLILLFTSKIILSQNDYFLDNRLNCNNVNGAISTPKQSTEYVKYLGEFSNTDECINACINGSSTDNYCESYTYYTSKSNGKFSRQCYGRFGYPLWIPIAEENINCGRIIHKCMDDLSCSLNGQCNKQTGNCTCDTQWSGYKCGVLNLLPADETHGYHVPNTSSWGGVIISNKSDPSTYHMFVSEMINNCGINSWVLNSQIIHAESTNGYDSSYEKKQIIKTPFAHEPDSVIYHSNSDQYAMYYTYYNYPENETKQCECSDGSTNMSTCTFAPAPLYQEAMIYSDNVNGPWSKPMNLWNVRTVDTNLAVIILDNGTVIGFSRIKPPYSQMHLVTATNWTDNATYIEHKNVLFPELTVEGTEDPFLYRDCNNRYHAIFHNMDPGDNLFVCGAHAFSEDGVNWVYGGYSWNNTVQFVNGKSASFSRRERPHFVFLSKDQCTIIALTTGVQYGGQFGDATYTLLQPVKH